jgi:hypothetical protein
MAITATVMTVAVCITGCRDIAKAIIFIWRKLNPAQPRPPPPAPDPLVEKVVDIYSILKHSRF